MTSPSLEPGTDTSARTVVVGGGIAGMTAAVSLAERGVPVWLLERDGSALGGRVASFSPVSFSYQGRSWSFSNDHGVHGLWRQHRNLLQFIERHGLAASLVDAADPSLVFDDGSEVRDATAGWGAHGPPIPEPLHQVLLLRNKNLPRLIRKDEIAELLNFGWHMLQAVHFDPNSESHRQRYDVRAVSDFMVGLPSFHQALLQSLSRSGFFAEPQEVSLWAFLVGLRLRAFPQRQGRLFSLCSGRIIENLFNPILPVIEKAGGRMALGVGVDRVRRSPDGSWSLDWVREDREGPRPRGFTRKQGILHADALILATDLVGAGKLLSRSPDLGGVYGDVASFEGRPAATVRIWYARCPARSVSESGVFSGRTFADKYFWLHSFHHEFVAWRLATGGSACECHVYAPDWKHALDDEEMIRRVKRDVERAFPVVANSAVHASVTRYAATNTSFPVGSAVTFPKVRTQHPSLALAGDWIDGGTPVLYMERACQTGILAANAMLERYGLPTWPVLDPAPSPPTTQTLERWLRKLDRMPLDLFPPSRTPLRCSIQPEQRGRFRLG